MPVSLISTPLPTWNGVAGAADCACLGAGGGSEKVRWSAFTRMLLAVSGLLAGMGAAGGALGLIAGFATIGAAAVFATTGAATAGVAGLTLTGAAALAGGAFAASLRAGCFAVSEVAFSAAGLSATGFAFSTPATA